MTQELHPNSIKGMISYYYLVAFCPPAHIKALKKASQKTRSALAKQSGLKMADFVKGVAPEVAHRMAAFQQAQDGLSSALSRLMVTVEDYPDLKANQNFMDLQHQLESTENRIAVERRKFNEVTRGYNTSIRRFPNSVIAGITGFDKKAYFEAAAGADTAPVVEF